MKRLELQDEEIVLLDGKVPRLQDEVDAAKARLATKRAMESEGLTPNQLEMVAEIVELARTARKVTFRHDRITYCPCCRKDAGYQKYKSGPRKGRDNWDKPLTISGFEFRESFITIRNRVSVGGCSDCVKPALPAIRKALEGVEAEISEHLTGHKPRFKLVPEMKCKCGWEGHELQLGLLPAMFGGEYRGKCPSCGLENRYGSSPIERKRTEVLVPMENA